MSQARYALFMMTDHPAVPVSEGLDLLQVQARELEEATVRAGKKAAAAQQEAAEQAAQHATAQLAHQKRMAALRAPRHVARLLVLCNMGLKVQGVSDVAGSGHTDRSSNMPVMNTRPVGMQHCST